MSFKLMILTTDIDFAIEAQDAGIDRIFFDLEYLNKIERQKGRNTVISNNNIEDIPKVRAVLKKSQLLVRTNPININSEIEIEKVILFGADIMMLPMVMNHQEVETYIKLINGRSKVCIMIETAQALSRIDKILEIKGVDEIFIGLNDLHISLGLSFMFEPLSCGLVEYLANKCKKRGIPFGFGGIARIGDGVLPAEKILGEHLRLGSESAILSRTFKGDEKHPQLNINLKKEVEKIHNCINKFANYGNYKLRKNQKDVVNIVNNIVYK